MDRVFDNPELVRKMVDHENASSMRVVSRAGRDAVKGLEEEAMLEYIHGGEMLSDFPVRWPCELCKEYVYQNYMKATCVLLLDKSSYRHEMQLFVYKDEAGAPLGVELRVISSKAWQEDGHGRIFHMHSLIRTKRMLVRIIESGCWHPDFIGQQNRGFDIEIISDAIVAKPLKRKHTWDYLVNLIEEFTYSRRIFDLCSFRCDVLEQQIFIKFNLHFCEYRACLAQRKRGISLAITENRRSAVELDTTIFSRILSVGRIIHLLSAPSYWIRGPTPKYLGRSRMTLDPSEHVVHAFQPLEMGLTGPERELEYLLQYISGDDIPMRKFVNRTYFLCEECTQWRPMQEFSTLLLYSLDKGRKKDVMRRSYRHNLQIFIHQNEHGAFMGVTLRVTSSRPEQEDWEGLIFHVHNLIESERALQRILDSGCWHPFFDGEQDPALDLEIVPCAKRGNDSPMDRTWRRVCMFLAKLRKENVYIFGWMHCFKYTDLGNEVIFNFTTRNSSYRHTGKATCNENGITLTVTTDNNLSHDGTMRPHSVTFSRIYSVGRIVHILVNRYWHPCISKDELSAYLGEVSISRS